MPDGETPKEAAEQEASLRYLRSLGRGYAIGRMMAPPSPTRLDGPALAWQLLLTEFTQALSEFHAAWLFAFGGNAFGSNIGITTSCGEVVLANPKGSLARRIHFMLCCAPQEAGDHFLNLATKGGALLEWRPKSDLGIVAADGPIGLWMAFLLGLLKYEADDYVGTSKTPDSVYAMEFRGVASGPLPSPIVIRDLLSASIRAITIDMARAKREAAGKERHQSAALTETDVKILRSLARTGIATTLPDLEVQTGKDRSVLSPRLHYLHDNGLVSWPPKTRKGATILPKGRDAFTSLNAP